MCLAVFIDGLFHVSDWDESQLSAWMLMAAMVVAFQAIHRAGSAGSPALQKAWALLALAMLLLALDKQIDLVAPVLNWFKGLSKEQGWYSLRRYLVAAALSLSALTFGWLGYVCRAALWKYIGVTCLISLGLILLLCLLFFRVATFHYVEPRTGLHVGCARSNWAVELAALFFLFIGTLKRIRASARPGAVTWMEAGPEIASPRER